MTLPDLLPVSEIQVRLQQVFPEGVENRVWLTRNMAARVVYVMLYIGAIEGEQHSLGPKHVYAMSDRQMARTSDIAPRQIAFVNAYRDRNDPALRRTFGSLAWNSFAWFMSEPDNIVVLGTHPALGTGRILEPLD